MAFSMAGGGPSRPEINVTPLIDVLLVLIIVFMVIVAEQPKDKGLDAQIPQPAPPGQKESPVRTIVIQVLFHQGEDAQPELKINQDSVSWDQLKARLAGIYNTRAEKVAFVKGANEVDFQYVADVIDIARDAGVKKVGLLTSKD